MENTEKNKFRTDILLTILYGALTLLLVMHHEIWADEAQVWLLVKNLSVFGLFKHLVNEGHPSFFYLLVMPFAKLNFSIFAMQIICWLGSVLGAFMVLRYSPFNKFTKFAILVSAGFIYFFPVIARSYSLLPLMISLSAYFYTQNKRKPLIYALVLAVTTNIHVIMFAFTGVLGTIFLYDNVIKDWKNFDKEDKIKNLTAFGIICFGLIALVLQLCGTIGNNSAIGFSFKEFFYGAHVITAQFFLNIVDYTVVKTHAVYGLTLYGAVSLFVLFIFSLIILLFTNIRMFLTAFFGIGFQLMIYIVSYHSYVYPTRIACAYLIFLFCFWVILADPNFKNRFKILSKTLLNSVLALMFLLTSLNGFRFAVLDLFNNYSSAKDTAVYIEKNIPESALVITANDPFSLGLYYYLPENRMWSIMKQKYIKYVVWDTSLEMTFMKKDWSRIVRGKFADEYKTREIYVILPSFMNFSKYEIFPEKDFKVIYKSAPSIADGEAFKIYKFIGK